MATTEKLLKKAGDVKNGRMPPQQMTALADRMDGLIAELQVMVTKLREGAREGDRAPA